MAYGANQETADELSRIYGKKPRIITIIICIIIIGIFVWCVHLLSTIPKAETTTVGETQCLSNQEILEKIGYNSKLLRSGDLSPKQMEKSTEELEKYKSLASLCNVIVPEKLLQ